MIDNPDQTDRLLTALRTALPLSARLTPELAATLGGSSNAQIPLNCSIGWVSYAGDEAGIVCRLDFEQETGEQVFASITHLRFDTRLPLAREIAAYQKHRVKRRQRPPH